MEPDRTVQKHFLCRSVYLNVGGKGWRFEVQKDGEKQPAFAVRSSVGVSAFLNKCGHRDLELDWTPGEFFDLDARLLICATHGALYDPQTGACKGGPCNGVGLHSLSVTEEGGLVYLTDVNYSVVSSETA